MIYGIMYYYVLCIIILYYYFFGQKFSHRHRSAEQEWRVSWISNRLIRSIGPLEAQTHKLKSPCLTIAGST